MRVVCLGGRDRGKAGSAHRAQAPTAGEMTIRPRAAGEKEVADGVVEGGGGGEGEGGPHAPERGGVCGVLRHRDSDEFCLLLGHCRLSALGDS